MRLKNIPGADEYINESPYVVNDPTNYKGIWSKDAFCNDNPLHIEIGMGKGSFITTMSLNKSNINYIGMDRYSSVLIKAVKKVESLPFHNLLIMCADARSLGEYFDTGEVDRIYLNFSDPWPKKRHAKRRLTHQTFLKSYHDIISSGGLIEFKTDNTDLFNYSLMTIDSSPLWEMCDYTYDLHNNDVMNKDNVMTEYEEKFSSMGNPIHKLVAKSI